MKFLKKVVEYKNMAKSFNAIELDTNLNFLASLAHNPKVIN